MFGTFVDPSNYRRGRLRRKTARVRSLRAIFRKPGLPDREVAPPLSVRRHDNPSRGFRRALNNDRFASLFVFAAATRPVARCSPYFSPWIVPSPAGALFAATAQSSTISSVLRRFKSNSVGNIRDGSANAACSNHVDNDDSAIASDATGSRQGYVARAHRPT